MDVEKRVHTAVESILENEALRGGLEDQAAAVLMEWGTERAKRIGVEVAGLPDQAHADEIFNARMHALRELLHIAARICVENPDSTDTTILLEKVTDLLPLVYGEGTPIPETGQWNSLLAVESGSAQEKMVTFRNLVENDPSIRKGD
jgi:hypothetical protein